MPRDSSAPALIRTIRPRRTLLVLIVAAALGPFTLLPTFFDVYILAAQYGQVGDSSRGGHKPHDIAFSEWKTTGIYGDVDALEARRKEQIKRRKSIDPYKYPHVPVRYPWWHEAPPNETTFSTGNVQLLKEADKSCLNRDRHCSFSNECKQRASLLNRCERRCKKTGYGGKWLPTSIFCQKCKYAKKVPESPCEKAAFRCKQSQLACTTKMLTSIQPGHLKWFSMWDENKYRPDEFLGWANFGFSGNFTAIRHGAKYGFTHLFKVGQFFWERTNGYHSPLRLRDDYKERWASIYLEVLELYEAGIIFGFCIGDELLWSGVDWEMIGKAADLLRHDFPGAVIWLNEAVSIVMGGCDHYHTCRNWTNVPQAISWFSVDKYWTSDHFDHMARIKDIYEKHVYPRLWPHQSVVLLPGAFSSKRNTKCKQECYENFCTKDASEFAMWAARDPRVAAITPYHWHYCRGCARSKNEIGVIDMNTTKVMWQQIGQAIVRATGSVAGQIADLRLNIDAFLVPDSELGLDSDESKGSHDIVSGDEHPEGKANATVSIYSTEGSMQLGDVDEGQLIEGELVEELSEQEGKDQVKDDEAESNEFELEEEHVEKEKDY